MIYLVTKQTNLQDDSYKIISVEESLKILESLTIVGLDTETTGLNCHKDKLLSVQLGCKKFQVVVDCTTIDIQEYKSYLESDRVFILWNAKFDLKWLYRYHIVPKNVYDGFLAEKIMWLGYPIVLTVDMWNNIKCDRYDYFPGDSKKDIEAHYKLQMNLKKAGEMYLGVELDKSVRGKIIYLGLTPETIAYSANDVKYLEDIKNCQEKLLKEKGLMLAMSYSNKFILALAYMEFCGVKVDINKWIAKMNKDNEQLESYKKQIDEWLIKNDPTSPYITINRQGNLFEGFDLSPKVTVNWKSHQQVIPIFKKFGVNLEIPDKKTKKNKDSIDIKVLAPQKDKCSLIPLYIKYKEMEKQRSSFGENILKQIDKESGRLYSRFNPFGTDTCRISSGGKDKAKGIKYINLLNLPSDAETRACFIAEEGNRWISIDYSGQESFIMADMANDKEMINELTYGEKDLHTLTAKLVFPYIPKEMPAKEVKKKFHEERSKAKGYEFAFNYAGNASTIQRNFGLTAERANNIYNSYMKGFNGLKAYIDLRKKDWWEKGYINLNPKVGFKANIYDYPYLKKVQESFSEPGFWEYYREMKAIDRHCSTVEKVTEFFRRRSDSDRQSVNYPIQHTGALCYMVSMINFFEYLRKKDLLFKVLITITPYDEINCEAPAEIAETIADILYKIMVKSGELFVKRVKLDADISRLEDGTLPTYWIH